MSNSFKKALGAGLLTLAVVGSTVTYLSNSLKPAPVQYSQEDYTSKLPQQPERHPVVTVIEERAS